MPAFKNTGASLAIGFVIAIVTGSSVADVWVFEPSVTLDQRFDDNYYLLTTDDGGLNATRAVGELGLSREAEALAIRGLIRVDGLLTTSSDLGNEELDSNQFAAFDLRQRSARARYGFRASFKQDTPSRDIAADLSDPDSLASDSDVSITQSLSNNVARRNRTFNPSLQYDLTRRLMLDVEAEFSDVSVARPDPQDAIYDQYLLEVAAQNDGVLPDNVLPYDQVTLNDINGGVFTPSNELGDFDEGEFTLGIRYKLDPISVFTATATLGRSNFEVDPDPGVIIPFEQLVPDPDVRQIVRKPRRESVVTTQRFVIGYQRFLTPTLQFGVDGGVYVNKTDNADTFREDDIAGGERPDNLINETDGWIASVTLDYDAGRTRYQGKFSVDVAPSSVGAQTETNELTGALFHTYSPRMQFVVRARAYEPDRLGANQEDEFARRFISFEPKIEWQYTRNWTLSAAYRYRRQRARIAFESAESNAILLALKYTPPSKIRDAATANGL